MRYSPECAFKVFSEDRMDRDVSFGL
jgi:putative transposase